MRQIRSTILFAACAGTAIVSACGSNGGSTGGSVFPGDGGDATASSGSSSGSGSGCLTAKCDASSGGGSSGGSGGMDATVADADFPCDGCAPFPPADAGTCAPGTLGEPTLVYPLDGVLLPPNMNVLEVQWLPPAGADLFEVDFVNAITNVRVETPCIPVAAVRRPALDAGAIYQGCGLTLPQAAWNDIANGNRDGDPVKVVVRAAPASGSCTTASQESVNIMFAKDNLTGGIYYWQSGDYGEVAGQAGGIYYHDFGTFDPTPTPFWTATQNSRCIGCHTLSKDGVQMSLMNDDPDADDEYGDVSTLSLTVATRTVTGGVNVGPGFQTFTHDHALMIASMWKMANDTSFGVWSGDGTKQLATDALPKMGTQTLLGTQPNLSWDDKTLVFASPSYNSMGMSTVSMAGDHHFLGGSLWSASFDKATYALSNFAEILTAAGSENFYYPDQSVDGNWIVFNENDDTSAANNTGDCFYSRQAVVKIMHFPPQAGDTPLTLSNLNLGPGLTNSWPRWSPAPTSYHGKPVLWVTFSSNRDYGLHLKNTVNGYPAGMPLEGGSGPMSFDNYYPPESPTYDAPQPTQKMGIYLDDYAEPQIWMAAVVIDPSRAIDGTDRSYPAFWLPFQDVNAHNHSAQWVAQVQTTTGGDGGTGSSSGGGSGSGSGGTPMCGESGAACGTGTAACCTDVVCCAGTCETGCAQ